MQNNIFPNLRSMIINAIKSLKSYGAIVKTDTWQGVPNQHDMLEILNLYLRAPILDNKEDLFFQTGADLPWAEDHFLERVDGKPLNPGEQYKNWPGYKNKSFNDSNFRKDEIFTHTYMERYWPKYTNMDLYHPINMGIRYEYGDLKDVIKLLVKDPYTRQAYLPVWFPEDTGVLHGGRVPCSLGYHFILRDNKLNIHYTLRSCDALRHFRNDVYLTCRLLQWVLKEIKEYQKDWETINWDKVTPGILTMDIISFHTFYKEINLI